MANPSEAKIKEAMHDGCITGCTVPPDETCSCQAIKRKILAAAYESEKKRADSWCDAWAECMGEMRFEEEHPEGMKAKIEELKSQLAQARERLAKMEHEQKEYDFGKLREKVWDWKFRGCPETSFYDGNLPNISVKSDVVQIFKNRFSEFRDRYFMLFAFACAVIGKEDFNIFDIENYLSSKYTEALDAKEK